MKRSVSIIVVCMFLMFSGIAQADLMDGLVAYYSFAGDASDQSGNGNDGTIYGATLTTDRFGNPNSAYELSGNQGPYGSGNYIDIPDMIEGFDNLTLSLWVNEYSIGYVHGEDYISFGAPNYGLVHISHQKYTGLLQFTISNSNGMIGFGNSFDDNWIGEFQHYALVYDGINGQLKGYVNGELFGEISTSTGSITAYSDYAALGKHWFGDGITSSTRLNGVFDDVLIYNRALSEAEILDIYNTPNPVPEPATMLLLGTGFVGLAGFRRKRIK